MIYLFILIVPCYDYFMSYLIHATPIYIPMPTVFLILLVSITISVVTIATIILLLLLLFYCCHHITVTTDKLLPERSFSGVVELTTQLLRLINILWLPLYRINKLGLYFPQRLLRSPTLVGHQLATSRGPRRRAARNDATAGHGGEQLGAAL